MQTFLPLVMGVVIFLVIWALYNGAYKRQSALPFPMTVMAVVLIISLLLSFLGPDALPEDSHARTIVLVLGFAGMMLVLAVAVISSNRPAPVKTKR